MSTRLADQAQSNAAQFEWGMLLKHIDTIDVMSTNDLSTNAVKNSWRHRMLTLLRTLQKKTAGYCSVTQR